MDATKKRLLLGQHLCYCTPATEGMIKVRTKQTYPMPNQGPIRDVLRDIVGSVIGDGNLLPGVDEFREGHRVRPQDLCSRISGNGGALVNLKV